MNDEWPPPYEYVGTPTAWTRVARDFGDPIPHVHHCPECYERRRCSEPCTLEPDLEESDGTPCGSHMVCLDCDRKWTLVENAIFGASEQTKNDLDNEVFRALQLELDLGA